LQKTQGINTKFAKKEFGNNQLSNELRTKHITKSGIKYQHHVAKIESKIMQETLTNTPSTQNHRRN